MQGKIQQIQGKIQLKTCKTFSSCWPNQYISFEKGSEKYREFKYHCLMECKFRQPMAMFYFALHICAVYGAVTSRGHHIEASKDQMTARQDNTRRKKNARVETRKLQLTMVGAAICTEPPWAPCIVQGDVIKDLGYSAN